MFCNVPPTHASRWCALGSSIYDERQTKLLAAGMEITEQLLATLTRRNVESVVVSQLDLGRILAFQPQGKARHILGDRWKFRPNTRTTSVARWITSWLPTHCRR